MVSQQHSLESIADILNSLGFSDVVVSNGNDEEHMRTVLGALGSGGYGGSWRSTDEQNNKIMKEPTEESAKIPDEEEDIATENAEDTQGTTGSQKKQQSIESGYNYSAGM